MTFTQRYWVVGGLVIIILIAVIIAISFITKPRREGEISEQLPNEVWLRYKFQKGDLLEYKIIEEITYEAKTSEQKTYFSAEVKDINNQKVASIESFIYPLEGVLAYKEEKFKIPEEFQKPLAENPKQLIKEMEQGGVKIPEKFSHLKIEAISTKKAREIAREMIKQMTRHSFIYYMEENKRLMGGKTELSEDGKILSIKPLSNKEAADYEYRMGFIRMVEYLFEIFPPLNLSKKIKKGDSWKADRNVSMQLNINGKYISFEYNEGLTFVLEDFEKYKDNNCAKIKFHSTSSNTLKWEGKETETTSSKEGYVFFDLQRGIPVAQDVEISRIVRAKRNGESETKQQIKLKISLLNQE